MDLIQDISQIGGYGAPLDKQGIWLLGHLTKGDFNAVLGKWTPQFPTVLNPALPNGIFTSGFPLLKIFQNLQISVGGILNNILPNFGNALSIRAGFLNVLPIDSLVADLSHMTGFSIDFGVQGFAANPALIAKDVQQMLGGAASAINMIFNTANNDGHFHVDVNAGAVLGGATSGGDTQISTTNIQSGETVAGEFAFMNGYSS